MARGDSKWLDNVLTAFWELNVKKAHRRQIAEKVREIRESEGLHLGNYVAWTQYVLGHYSRGKSWHDFFRPVRLGSGWWECLEA